VGEAEAREELAGDGEAEHVDELSAEEAHGDGVDEEGALSGEAYLALLART
jgi:hypothetical protein